MAEFCRRSGGGRIGLQDGLLLRRVAGLAGREGDVLMNVVPSLFDDPRLKPTSVILQRAWHIAVTRKRLLGRTAHTCRRSSDRHTHTSKRGHPVAMSQNIAARERVRGRQFMVGGLHATTVDGTQTGIEATEVAAFQASLRGKVLRDGDGGYDDARKVWNGMIDKRPALIARCVGVADVIDAVNFARTKNLLISVRGGGHNITGNAVCDGGLMIDLSLMKGLRVDPIQHTAHAQAGLTWGEYNRETQAFGLASTGGVISTTGIAGLTLGGGLGWLMGKHGLSCDNLLSADIVTADGRCLTALPRRTVDWDTS